MEIIGFVTGVIAVVIAIGLVWYCHSELTKMAVQTQNALDLMSKDSQVLLDGLAKQQGDALKEIIEKQSKINKVYKKHIETLLTMQKYHSQILKFQADTEPTPVSIDMSIFGGNNPEPEEEDDQVSDNTIN